MLEEAKDFVSRKEFNIERDRINDKVSEQSNRISVVETLCASLKDLPRAITKLDTTMALLGQNFENLNTEFKTFVERKEKEKEQQAEKDSGQNKRISEIDNKSKVDFLVWIRNNWMVIVSFIATLSLIVKDLLK